MAYADSSAIRSARRQGAGAAAAGAAVERVPLLVVLLFLSVLVLPLKFFAGPLVLTSHRLILLIMCIPLLVQLFSGQAGRVRLIDIGVILYAFWAVVTIAYHHGLEVVEFGGSTTVEMLGGYLVGRVCIRSVGQLLAFGRFFGILILCTLPFAIHEALTGSKILLQTINSLPFFFGPAPWLNSPPRLGLDRVQLVLDTAIHYGLMAAMAFSLVVAGQSNAWSLSRRILAGFGIFLCSFLSLSSGAFLAMLLQLGLVAWAVMLGRNENRWVICAVLSAIFYVIIEVLSDRDAITVFLSYATFSPASAYYRQLIFQFGMDNVWANPFFGIGLNDWVRPIWMFVRSVDNFWLLTAMRHGIPAFLALAGAWLVLLWKVGRLRPEPGCDAFWARRGWMFTMFGLTFTLSTVHIWGGSYTLVFCFMGMGVFFLDAGLPVAGGQPQPRGAAPAADPDAATPERAYEPDEAVRTSRYTRFPGGPRRGGAAGPRAPAPPGKRLSRRR